MNLTLLSVALGRASVVPVAFIASAPPPTVLAALPTASQLSKRTSVSVNDSREKIHPPLPPTLRPSLNETPLIVAGASVSPSPLLTTSVRWPMAALPSPPPLMVSDALPGPVIVTLPVDNNNHSAGGTNGIGAGSIATCAMVMVLLAGTEKVMVSLPLPAAQPPVAASRLAEEIAMRNVQ